MDKKSAFTEISEIQGSSSKTLTNAKDIADPNKHLTPIGPDLARKISSSSVNPEDYLRREPWTFAFTDPSRVLNLLFDRSIKISFSLDNIYL